MHENRFSRPRMRPRTLGSLRLLRRETPRKRSPGGVEEARGAVCYTENNTIQRAPQALRLMRQREPIDVISKFSFRYQNVIRRAALKPCVSYIENDLSLESVQRTIPVSIQFVENDILIHAKHRNGFRTSLPFISYTASSAGFARSEASRHRSSDTRGLRELGTPC